MAPQPYFWQESLDKGNTNYGDPFICSNWPDRADRGVFHSDRLEHYADSGKEKLIRKNLKIVLTTNYR